MKKTQKMVHNAFVVTELGGEVFSQIEIKEIIDSDSIAEKKVVFFQFNQFKDLAKLAYFGQSFERVVYMFDKGIFSDLEDLKKKIKLDKKKIEYFIKKYMTFAVMCERYGEHNFNSQLAEKEIGNVIYDFLENNFFSLKADLENPKIIFFLFIYENRYYFGIDFAGFDLSKRDYRIFSGHDSLKGTVAYCLIRFALGQNKKISVLDPFAGSGTIPIECAYYLNKFSHNFFRKKRFAFNNFLDLNLEEFDQISQKKKLEVYGFDKEFKYLLAMQKNAKIGGVFDFINLSRCEVDWIDTKFKNESIDYVITQPPIKTKLVSEDFIIKIYRQFFNRIKSVLKREGIIAFITPQKDILEKSILNENYEIVEQRSIWQGKKEYFMFKIKKKNGSEPDKPPFVEPKYIKPK